MSMFKDWAGCLGALGGVCCVVLGAKVIFMVVTRRRLAKARNKWENVGKDVVVLHCFPRMKNCINTSPFPIKLELFLRMNKIKYVTEFTHYMSSKGKSPWITFNGVDVADSQLAIEHLQKHFDIDMMSHLGKVDRAVARSFRIMLEDHLYWSLVVEKWKYGRGRSMLSQIKFCTNWLSKFLTSRLLELAAKKLEQQAYSQGMGRHTREEVIKMGFEDLEALQDFLGDKAFMMGEKPTELDCTAFGFLSIFFEAPMSEKFCKEIEVRFPGLARYCKRVKESYFSDWDQLLTNDPTELS